MLRALRRLWLLAAALAVAFPAVSADTLELRADNWCPYTCAAETGREGIITDIVRHIFERQGYTVNYQLVPWNRGLREVAAGRAQMILGITPEEAPELTYGQTALFSAHNHWFVRNNSAWRYEGQASLEALRLGAVAGYHYGEEIDRYIDQQASSQQVQLLSVSNPVIRNLLKLRQGRIDVLIEDCLVVSRQLNRYPEVQSAGLASRIPLYVGIASEHPKANQWAAILDQGVVDLSRSGELAKLIAPYSHPLCDETSPALPLQMND